MRYTEVIWSEDSEFVWETSPAQFLFLFLLVSTNRMRSWELYHEAEKTGHSIAGGTAGGRALDKDTKYTIHGVNGGTNELVIADGQVWLEEASCPDKLCVHQGKIQYAGQSIICLPNQVSVTIEDEQDKNGVDVVAQ